MLPSERRNEILEKLKNQYIITINEFMEVFNISIETVRRDLNLLEEQGKIEKVYGGAKLKKSGFNEPAMNLRMIEHQELKDAIGRTCSEYVNNGDCIYIDSGSTTFHIAKHLKDKKNLTVITNSIPVISELSQSDFDILIIGGRFRKSERAIVTFNFMFNFDQLNIQKCFICASGITAENGISDFNIHEVETRRQIMKRSQEIYVAADSSKFGVDVLFKVAPIESLDYIVTDFNISKHYIKAFSNIDVKLIVAKEE